MSALRRNDIGARVHMTDLRTGTVREGTLVDLVNDGQGAIVETDEGTRWRCNAGFVSLVKP